LIIFIHSQHFQNIIHAVILKMMQSGCLCDIKIIGSGLLWDDVLALSKGTVQKHNKFESR
jgi:hypothetical protein